MQQRSFIHKYLQDHMGAPRGSPLGGCQGTPWCISDLCRPGDRCQVVDLCGCDNDMSPCSLGQKYLHALSKTTGATIEPNFKILLWNVYLKQIPVQFWKNGRWPKGWPKENCKITWSWLHTGLKDIKEEAYLHFQGKNAHFDKPVGLIHVYHILSLDPCVMVHSFRLPLPCLRPKAMYTPNWKCQLQRPMNTIRKQWTISRCLHQPSRLASKCMSKWSFSKPPNLWENWQRRTWDLSR